MISLKKQMSTKTYIIHQKMDNSWKIVKQTKDPSDIHQIEWWYFNRIIQEDLDYIVAGNTMYDIIYHNEYL